MSDDLKAVSFEELRNLCQRLEDTLSDATLIIDRQEDSIEELEAKLAITIEALLKLRRRQDCLETFCMVVNEIVETAFKKLEGKK